MDLKFTRAELIALRQDVKQRGLPREVVIALKQKGFSKLKIARFKKRTQKLRADQFDTSKIYLNYSKRLQKLANSIEETTW